VVSVVEPFPPPLHCAIGKQYARFDRVLPRVIYNFLMFYFYTLQSLANNERLDIGLVKSIIHSPYDYGMEKKI